MIHVLHPRYYTLEALHLTVSLAKLIDPQPNGNDLIGTFIEPVYVHALFCFVFQQDVEGCQLEFFGLFCERFFFLSFF